VGAVDEQTIKQYIENQNVDIRMLASERRGFDRVFGEYSFFHYFQSDKCELRNKGCNLTL